MMRESLIIVNSGRNAIFFESGSQHHPVILERIHRARRNVYRWKLGVIGRADRGLLRVIGRCANAGLRGQRSRRNSDGEASWRETDMLTEQVPHDFSHDKWCRPAEIAVRAAEVLLFPAIVNVGSDGVHEDHVLRELGLPGEIKA